MENPFKDSDKQALIIYWTKHPKYGDSWKEMTLFQLQGRLQEEFNELMKSNNKESLHHEALDVMNVARMIAERTKEEKR